MTAELSAPTEVHLILTRRCNLRCKHCSANSGAGNHNEIGTDLWLRLIDQLEAMKVFQIILTGGEIFLRKDILTILDYVLQRKFAVQIDTNGTMISQEIAERLSHARNLCLLVGLDGACSDTHEKLRGLNSFKKVLAGMSNLKRSGIPFHTFCVVTHYNKDEVEDVFRLALQNGATKADFSVAVPTGRAACYSDDLSLDQKEIQRLAKKYRHLIDNKEYRGKIGGAFLGRLALICQDAAPEDTVPDGQGSQTLRSCGAARTTATVTPEGNVVPCRMAESIIAGNIKENSFFEIYKRSSVFVDIRKHIGISLDEVYLCRDCRKKSRCHGVCLAEGYAHTGKWPSGSYACYIADKLHRRIQ